MKKKNEKKKNEKKKMNEREKMKKKLGMSAQHIYRTLRFL